MHTSTVFVISAWVLIVPLGAVMIHAALRAHRDIDHGLMKDARVPMLLVVGYTLLTLAFVGTMFGIRYLVRPLIVPAIVGSFISLFSLWLVIRASQRIHSE